MTIDTVDFEGMTAELTADGRKVAICLHDQAKSTVPQMADPANRIIELYRAAIGGDEGAKAKAVRRYNEWRQAWPELVPQTADLFSPSEPEPTVASPSEGDEPAGLQSFEKFDGLHAIGAVPTGTTYSGTLDIVQPIDNTRYPSDEQLNAFVLPGLEPITSVPPNPQRPLHVKQSHGVKSTGKRRTFSGKDYVALAACFAKSAVDEIAIGSFIRDTRPDLDVAAVTAKAVELGLMLKPKAPPRAPRKAAAMPKEDERRIRARLRKLTFEVQTERKRALRFAIACIKEMLQEPSL